MCPETFESVQIIASLHFPRAWLLLPLESCHMHNELAQGQVISGIRWRDVVGMKWCGKKKVGWLVWPPGNQAYLREDPDDPGSGKHFNELNVHRALRHKGQGCHVGSLDPGWTADWSCQCYLVIQQVSGQEIRGRFQVCKGMEKFRPTCSTLPACLFRLNENLYLPLIFA